MFSRQRAVLLILLVLMVGFAVIVLLRAEEQKIARGIVQDETGNPITGAVVRWRGGDAYVLTGVDGRFQIPVDDDSAQLTAWYPNYYIGGGIAWDSVDENLTLVLREHPTTDNIDYEFISPVLDMDHATACSHCHSERTGETNGEMPVDQWLRDAHAGAAVNPRFLSLYNGTTIEGNTRTLTTFEYDSSQGVAIPVAPSMGQDGVGAGYRLDYPDQTGSCASCHVPVLALKEGYTADPNHAEGVAAEGITCDFCHKVQNVRLRPDGTVDPGLPGVLSMVFLRPPEDEQVFIGPFDDTPGDDIFSALQNQSQFCASCHSGQFWDVPIYNSFGEWLESPYNDAENGQTCQDCHMPHTEATTFVQFPPGHEQVIPARDADTIFSHQMPGAADQTLLQNTATLDVEARRTTAQLEVTVRVTNSGAGHHIPTDNPLRNMILLVQAVDAGGNPLTLAAGPTIPVWGGEGDPTEGYYAGQPGVLYARLLADAYTGEMPSYAYWRKTTLVNDNRIPALATDETAYIFTFPPDAGEITVEARLYLRRAFIELMELKGWDTPDMLMEQQIVRLP